MLQDRFERGWLNAQHRYTTRFAAMLQKKAARFNSKPKQFNLGFNFKAPQER